MACIVVAWALCSGPSGAPRAHASGLSAPGVGSSRSGPATVDAASTWWNPANLALLDRISLLGGAAIVTGRLAYQRDRRATYQMEDSFDFAVPISPDAIDARKSGPAETVSSTPFGVSPSVFLGVPFGESGLALGLGIHAPYAAVVSYPADGPQRWALRDATLAMPHFGGAVAWRPHDRIAIGVGGSAVFGFAELSRVLDLASLSELGEALGNPPIGQPNDFGPEAPPGVRELSVMSRDTVLRRATGWSGTFNAGLTVRPLDDVRISLSYLHSVPLTMRGSFQMDMDDDFFTEDLASQGLDYVPLVEGDASLSLTLPKQAWLAVGWDPTPRWTVALSAGWTGWSSIESFDVRVRSDDLVQRELGLPATQSVALPRDWHDTAAVEALVEWHRSAKLDLWAVAGWQSGAVPDQTVDASSPDGTRGIAALGARLGLTERTGLLVDVETQFLGRRVDASDHDLGNGQYRMTLVSIGILADVAF